MKHIGCGHEEADLKARLDEAAARGATDIADREFAAQMDRIYQSMKEGNESEHELAK